MPLQMLIENKTFQSICILLLLLSKNTFDNGNFLCSLIFLFKAVL